ncbi:hypothetical protein [Leeuwenhoekiella parthenopeia]|uniref:Uncharacterized protein n=1 Tax=Leeuwenhoekiella parthenopeia TaxID=2890320 RepID=A0ABS8GVQ5_9FLAO|nr:hypothetical protein [Leeuwenhoekiella parthenopeia]MCC4214100.1 hypothetical protein [Leeuwenhoekiella parthenopeia]
MSTTSKPKENYWGYILFAALFLLYTTYSDGIWETLLSSDNGNGKKPKRNISALSRDNQEEALSYCSLTTSEAYDYLINTRSFTLNGYGSVSFKEDYNHGSRNWEEGIITISGSGYRLTGNWKLSRNKKINVYNLIATGGNYDASANTKTRGHFLIECNGNLKGILIDPNGNTRDIIIKKIDDFF